MKTNFNLLTYANQRFNVDLKQLRKASYFILSQDLEQVNKLLPDVIYYKKINDNNQQQFNYWATYEKVLKDFKTMLKNEIDRQANYLPIHTIFNMLKY